MLFGAVAASVFANVSGIGILLFLVFTVYQFMAYNELYKSFDPDKSVMLLVVSVLSCMLAVPFILFYYRKSSMLCNNCSMIRSKGSDMTLRELISSDIFNEFDGKSVLLFHLHNNNACPVCIEKAENHLKSFVIRNNINFDVDKYCKDLYTKTTAKEEEDSMFTTKIQAAEALDKGAQQFNNGQAEAGLRLINDGLKWFYQQNESPSFGHCFELGMLLNNIKDSSGNRDPVWQDRAVWLMEKAAANEAGMELLRSQQPQIAMILTQMLEAAKGEQKARKSIDTIAGEIDSMFA